MEPFNCELCRKPFLPSKFSPPGVQRYCSRQCQVTAHHNRTRNAKKPRPL